MEGSTWNLLLTLLANALADRLTPAQLVQAATLVTQLGTTLGFLATQQTTDGETAPSAYTTGRGTGCQNPSRAFSQSDAGQSGTESSNAR